MLSQLGQGHCPRQLHKQLPTLILMRLCTCRQHMFIGADKFHAWRIHASAGPIQHQAMHACDASPVSRASVGFCEELHMDVTGSKKPPGQKHLMHDRIWPPPISVKNANTECGFPQLEFSGNTWYTSAHTTNAVHLWFGILPFLEESVSCSKLMPCQRHSAKSSYAPQHLIHICLRHL